MAFSNIERSYHDVTKLDKATALGKVKDVMDISSSAEFFTIVKDPDSIKPTCRQLKFIEGSTNFLAYMTPHAYYAIRPDGAVSSQLTGTRFGARVRIRKMEFNPNCELSINNAKQGQVWTENIDKIMHHCKAIWLYNNMIYFTPWFHQNPHGNTASTMDEILQQFNSISTVYHACISLNDVKNIEFEFFELHPQSMIANDDKYKIFNILNRIPSYNDYADKVLLTQSLYNTFSISLSNISSNKIDTLLDLMDDLLYCDGNLFSEAWWHRFIKDRYGTTFYNDNYGEIVARVEHIDPGPMRFGDPVFLPDKTYWKERLASDDALVLYDNMNHHGATFTKALFSLFGINVTIHTHSTKHLFEDITLKSITHSRSDELIIGNGNCWGVDSAEHRGIRFVENVSMDGNFISDIGSISGIYAQINDIHTLELYVGPQPSYQQHFENVTTDTVLTVYGGTHFRSNNDKTTTVQIDGTLDIEGYFKIPGIDEKTGNTNITNHPTNIGTLNDMPLLSIDSNGVFYKTDFKFDTTKNTDPNNTNQNTYSRKFLAIDGAWRDLDPGYLGAAISGHRHGQITNGGIIENGTAIATGYKLVITQDTSNNVAGQISKTTIAFDTAVENKRKFLSKYGDFNTLRDLVFLDTGNAYTNAADGVTANKFHVDNGNSALSNILKDANDAVTPGIYHVYGGYGGSQTEHLPSIDAGKSYAKASFASTQVHGILLVLTTDGNMFSTSNGVQRIVQVLFNSAALNADPANLINHYVFIRSCGNDGTWSDWKYFSTYDHNHDKEYAAIKEAKIATSIALYPLNSTTQQPTTTDNTWYKETLTKKTGVGNDNLDYVLHSSEATFSSSATPGFKWTIQSSSNTTGPNSKYGFYLYRDGYSTNNATIDYAAILNADTTVKGTLTVNSTSTFDGNVTLGSSTAAAALTVYGTSSFKNNVTIDSGKSLTVGGTTTLNGNVTIATGKTLTVGGTSTFNDNVTIATGKTLTVGGTSTFNGNVSVASGKTLQVGGTNVSLEGHTHTKANLTSWLGFGSLRTGEVSWGTVRENNGYTICWASDQTNGGGIAVGEKDGKTSIQVDGDIYINEGNTKLTGNTGTVTSISTSGTGLSGGTITGTGTITLNSSAEGNRTANQVVIAKANGQINSEKLAITSGATVKATMQYNSTEDCIDFIFA